MAQQIETEDEAPPISYGELCPELQGVRWLRGQAPTFSEPLTLIHLWYPSEQTVERFQKLNGLCTRFPGKLAVAALCELSADGEGDDNDEGDDDSEDDDRDEDDAAYVLRFLAPRDVHFSVGLAPSDVWAELERDDCAPLSFLFDDRKKLLWRGPEQAMAAVIEALATGKMSTATMKELASLREHYDSVDSDDELDYDEQTKQLHELACQILDRNPADTDMLGRILSAVQIDGDTQNFRALLARIDLAYWSPGDASFFARSLIESSSSPHLRPAGVALRLVEYAEKCSWLSTGALCACADVHAFIGDFQGAIRLLERAEKLEDDPNESPYRVREVIAAMRERASLHAASEQRRAATERRPPRRKT
jgi:hypothetical protein